MAVEFRSTTQKKRLDFLMEIRKFYMIEDAHSWLGCGWQMSYQNDWVSIKSGMNINVYIIYYACFNFMETSSFHRDFLLGEFVHSFHYAHQWN